MNKLPEIVSFSNIRSMLTFQAQFNNARKTSEMNSVTFYYQMTLPVKIHLEKTDKSIDDVYVRFEQTIMGELYGGVILSKYKTEIGVKSYLIYDGRNYKLGKSINPEKRLKEIKVGNYRATLVCSSEHIQEKFLHEVFAHRNVGGEWFDLIDSEVEIITKMMNINFLVSVEALMRMCARQIKRNQPNRSDIRIQNVIKEKRKEIKSYETTKLCFGKYSGKLISEMKSDQERKYLYWAYNNIGNMDKKIKNAIKIQISL